MFGRFADHGLCESASTSHLPSTPSRGGDGVVAGGRTRRGGTRSIHSQRLQSAMDELQRILKIIQPLNPEGPYAEGEVVEGEASLEDFDFGAGHEGMLVPATAFSGSPTDHTATTDDADATPQPTSSGAALDGFGSEAVPTGNGGTDIAEGGDVHERIGGKADAMDDGGDDAVVEPQQFRTGALLEYQREVLREYDNAMPPLRTLRLRTTAARAARFSTSQSTASPYGQGDIILTPGDARRLDVLRRRRWLELPDDTHELRCLMNGLDPTQSSSREKKTTRWFDGKPLYSPAVLLLAQVSQQQVQAMKKKHGKRGGGGVGGGGADGASESLGEGKGGTMSLDPPLKEAYHPFPRLADSYYDNDVYPLAYHDSRITPPEVAALLVAGEQRMRGVDKLQAFVSFRSIRRSSNGAADGGTAEFLDGLSNTSSGVATDAAVEHLLAASRSCVVISTTDASLAFTVVPTMPALQLFKPAAPRRPFGSQRRLSLAPFSSAPPEYYTVSWVEQWHQYLASEMRRYSNPRVAAKMYQALSLIHPNGTDCRMWVVKRLIRWMLKAKRSLLRFTLLRCRLVYSARKPHSECASLMLPAEMLSVTPRRSPTATEVLTPQGDGEAMPLSSASPSLPPAEEEEDAALTVDPLPLQDSGGVVLVRSSARRELLHDETMPLPQRPKVGENGEAMSEEDKESLRKAVQERVGAEVVLNVVVVPSFDHVSQHSGAAQDAQEATSQEDDAHSTRLTGGSRSEGADSFVETLTTKLCELIVAVEAELRHKETMYRTVAAEVHREIIDLQLKSGGVIQPRKKRVVPRSDGAQLGLIKSAATVDAQERANPVTTAISAALCQFHSFVVHDVILAPKGDRQGSAGSDGITKSPTTATVPQAEHAPGIVSLREVIARAFRDESRTAPDWTPEARPSKSRSGAAATAASAAPGGDGDVPEGAEDGDGATATAAAETEALKAFLRPVLRIDPVCAGNVKSKQLPYRLFQPAHMDFLENLHTFDDASLFNLRRRERCASSAEVIEEITELFQRLVEILTNIDTMSHDFSETPTANSSTAGTSTHFSQAVANRRARRAGGGGVTPSSAAEAAAAKKAAGQATPLIPRKQFGSVLRVLIDRMVRRFLANVVELLRMLTNDGRLSDTPLLDLVDDVRSGGRGAAGAGIVRNEVAADNTSQDSSRRTSMLGATVAGGTLGGCEDPEPQFSRLTEYTAACDGNRAQHRLCDFLQGWRWFVGNPTTVPLIWGPGKDLETDRDRMYDQMVAELRGLQREPLSSYAAFGGSEGSKQRPTHQQGAARGGAVSILHRLGESLHSNLSVTAPIAVAECCPLDGDDVDAICCLFPTVQNTGEGLRLETRRASGRRASNRMAPSQPVETHDGASTLGAFFGNAPSTAKQPTLTPYVGEEQFLFTILHVLDVCHVSVDSHAAVNVDGAAHLRGEAGRGKRKKAVAKPRRGVTGKRNNAGGAVLPFPPNSIDARDSMFFRWRFLLKLQPTAFAKDIRHCTLTLFEKNVTRDLLVDALMSLRQSLRSMHAREEEVHRVARLEERRAQELEPVDVGGVAVIPLGGDEGDTMRKETAMAEMLKKRAINKRMGLEMTADRRLHINCLMSRLNVALQSVTKEDRCVMAGVKELLEAAPPSERECFLLVQQMFAKEFEKWEAHRSLCDPPPPPTDTRVPHLSVSPAANVLSTAVHTPNEAVTPRLEGWVKPDLAQQDSARSSVSSPRGLKISIPAASTGTPLPTPMGTARSGEIPHGPVDSGDGRVDAVSSLRCERCHQPPASLLFRHKHQPQKRVVAYTEDEIDMLFSDPSSQSVSRRASETPGRHSISSSPPGSHVGSPARRGSSMAFGGLAPKHLTKVVTEYRDVFVCTACFAQYLAQCLVRKLIDAMHAAQAAEAADAAAAAAAMADKMRKQMNKELFGAHIPDEVTSDLFEQVQDVVRRRERESQKRAEQQRRLLEGDETSSEDDDDSDSDEAQGGGLFGRKRVKKKKKKKGSARDDDDDFSALSPGAAKKKRRNVLEDKLAAVMVGVQREQLLVHETTARVSIRKEALDAVNKLRVDLARAAYVERHGEEPTSLDDLVRDQSLVLEVESDGDDADTAQQKHLEDQQAEADRLMSMARQQSQSKFGSFKRTSSIVGRAGSIVKFVGKPVPGEAQGGSGVFAVQEGGDVDEFGLPPLRSQNGLSIDELRQRIEDAEHDIGNNKLMMLKKDLEERVRSLQSAKEELEGMMRLYAERKEQHEELLRQRAEARAAEQAADEKKKKAASLRAAVEKFKQKLGSKASSGGTSSVNAQADGSDAPMTDDDIIRIAEEAKKQQDAATDRLFRGANRRTSNQKLVELNVFDDDDEIEFPPHETSDHDSAPFHHRHTTQWRQHVDGWTLPSEDAVAALRTMCLTGTTGGLLHEQSLLAAATYGCGSESVPPRSCGGRSSTVAWTPYHLRDEFIEWKEAIEATTARADSSSRRHALLTEEWFTNGESDDVFHARDDSLILTSYVNRLEPLHWVLENQATTCPSGEADDGGTGGQQRGASSLRDVMLQCAFVQEAVCALLDVSCGLVRRSGMHPDHLEGYPLGNGGAMLALYGLGHPLEQELFQAIGAPTNSAALARTMHHLHEAARMMSPGTPASTAAANKYHPEHLVGEAQRSVAKFSRLFLSRVHVLRRRNGKLRERLTMVAMPAVRAAPHAIATNPQLLSPSDGTAADDGDGHEVQDEGQLEDWSPAVAALSSVDETADEYSAEVGADLRAEFTFEGDAMQPQTTGGIDDAVQLNEDDEEGDPSHGQRVSPWAVLRQAIKDTSRSDAGLGPSTNDAADEQQLEGKPRRRASRRLSKLDKNAATVQGSEPTATAATSVANEKPPRGFKEKLRKAAQSTTVGLRAGEEEKRLGCLAETILPGIEFVAPDGDTVHPSVTQAWWQVRLLVVALHRQYHARGFLSFRTLWVYARRLMLRDMRLLLAVSGDVPDHPTAAPPTHRSCCAALLALFTRPYRWVEDKAQQQQRQQQATTASSSPRVASAACAAREAADESLAGEDRQQREGGDASPASPASLTLDATLTSAPPHSAGGAGADALEGTLTSAASALGSPPPNVISLMHSPSGGGVAGSSVTFVDLPPHEVMGSPLDENDDDGRAADVDGAACKGSNAACAPPSQHIAATTLVKKYVKASTPLSALQQQLRTNALTLFHTHVALAHHALEEYSAGLIRAFTTIPGEPEPLLRPRDCLRFANTTVLRKLQTCVFAHADRVLGTSSGTDASNESKDARQGSSSVSEGEANRMLEFVTDLGRLALAVFVLGPVLEAKSVLSLAGLEAFDVDQHASDIRIPRGTTVSDCLDVVGFVEQRLFPGNGTLDDCVDEEKGSNSGTPAVSRTTVTNDCREDAVVDALLRAPVAGDAALSAWSDDGDQPQPSTAQRMSSQHAETPQSSSVRTASSPQGTDSKKRKQPAPAAKALFDLSPMHRRVLRVVDHILFHGHGTSAPRMDDDQRMKHLLDCSAHAFFYAAPAVDLMAYGVEFALFVLSSAVRGEGASPVVVGSRFHTPFRFLSTAAAPVTDGPQRSDGAPAAETMLHVLGLLASGVGALRAAEDEKQRSEHGGATETTDTGFSATVDPAEGSVSLLSASHRPTHRRAVEHRVVRIEGEHTTKRAQSNRKVPSTAPHVLGTVLTALDVALGCCHAEIRRAATSPARPATTGGGAPLLPLPWGDPHGGSAMTLHRYMTENLPAAQLRVHEEVRRRQRVFNRSLHAMLVRAAPLEARKLFHSIDAELPAGSPTLQDLFRHSVSDDDDSWALEERMSKNPLDVLRSQRLSRMSLTDALAEQLRENFPSHDSSYCGNHDSSFNTDTYGRSSASSAAAHQSGNAPLVGEASSPYISKGQRGSIAMERLLQKAADRAAMHLAMEDVFQASPRVVSPDNVQFTASMNALASEIRGFNASTGSPPSTADAAATSLNNTISQLRRMSVKMNRSIGSGLPPGLSDGVWDHGVTVAMVFNELQEATEQARLRWVRKGGTDNTVTPRRRVGGKGAPVEDGQEQRASVKPRLVSLVDEEDNDRQRDDEAAAYAESLRRSHGGPKEITEREVRRFRSNRKKSVDMALLDATGLLSTAEKQLNEFFVPVLSVACQLMEFSDRTRTELHRHVPPQWVEDSDTFMILQLDRRAHGDMEPTITAAFLHDVHGNIAEAQGDEYGALFASYRPGHAWRPGAARPAFPWVECTISRKKGIYGIECALGSYRISERVLQILIVSAEPPRIHVHQERAGSLGSFVFDPTDAAELHDAEDVAAPAPKLPPRQDISSLADSAALSAILHRKAMLRRFFMPSSTRVGSRISYSSRDPYDPDHVVRLEDERRRDYEGLYPLVCHSGPAGLTTDAASVAPENGSGGPAATTPSFINVDVTSYEWATNGGTLSTSPRQRTAVLPPIHVSGDASPKPRGKLASSPSKLQHMRDALDKPHNNGTVGKLPPLAQSAKPRGSNDAMDAPMLGDPPATKVVTKWSQLLPKLPVASRK